MKGEDAIKVANCFYLKVPKLANLTNQNYVKMSVFGVILVCIFLHSDWITLKTDTFNAVQNREKPKIITSMPYKKNNAAGPSKEN